MEKLKVINVDSSCITFEKGIKLYSDHVSDCCESHELYLSDLTINDFEGLEFNLSTDDFLKRIDGYGIELLPIHGHSVKIAGHGYNNGYYSTELTLIITNDKDIRKEYDISECQTIEG
jgi:hypothetical protein